MPVVQLANQQLVKPKIVAIGGGTGLAVLLKELRNYPADLTAIVTVFDSGRHSGALRKNLGILPPGDIRNCLVALSDSDELMNKLMNYRFKENFMEGCSLGNLLLAALTEIQGGFDKAITSLSDILNIHGNVLPATLDSTELCAELEDGSVVHSEVNVRSPVMVDDQGNERPKPPIKRVFLEKENVAAFLPAVKAIENADIVVLAPGGFYTSIISPLLVPGIRDAIKRSAAATVYISNVATQCGQTDGYSLDDTIEVLERYLGSNAIDYIIANSVVPSSELMAPYFSRGETLLLPTEELLAREHPVVLHGQTFQDIVLTPREWNKTHMIKHSGKMVVAMLYRIIDQEIERMNNNLTERRASYVDAPIINSSSGLSGMLYRTNSSSSNSSVRLEPSRVSGSSGSPKAAQSMVHKSLTTPSEAKTSSRRSTELILGMLVVATAMASVLRRP